MYSLTTECVLSLTIECAMIELTFENVPEDAKHSQNIYGKRDHLWQKRPTYKPYMAKDTYIYGILEKVPEDTKHSQHPANPTTK